MAAPQQRPPLRQRPKSGFSFRSDKSGGSGNKSYKKEPLVETPDEKRKAHLSVTGKANPNAAITELQPVAAALEEATLGSLRSMSHLDQFGNPITEPDRSNPTRPRWERPLETIRSFEAAIDNEYKQRQSYPRSEAGTEAGYGGGYSSRRSSTYWSGGYDQARPRHSTVGSYYGGNRDSYVDNNGYGGPPARNRFSVRQQSDPMLNRYSNPNGYPVNGQQQSRDTADTTSGSGSEQWTNNTDPSSENSSIDRVRATGGKSDSYEGQHGYPDNSGSYNNAQYGGPIMEEGGYGQSGYGHGANGGNGSFSQNAAGSQPPPPPPHKDAIPRKVISLNSNGNGVGPQGYSGNGGRPALQTQPSEKRKSWLRRKFSGKD